MDGLGRAARAPGAAPSALPRRARVAAVHEAPDPRLQYARHEYPDDGCLLCCAPPPACPAVPDKDAVGASVFVAVEDPEDRDPYRINQHLQLLWEDVVAEPEGARSPGLIWRGSARLFRLSRDLVYSSLSCVFGPPIAVVLGSGLAVVAFTYIWCVSPVLRACRVSLSALQSLVRAVTQSTLAPVAEGLGHVFANIRVRVLRADDAPPPPAVVGDLEYGGAPAAVAC